MHDYIIELYQNELINDLIEIIIQNLVEIGVKEFEIMSHDDVNLDKLDNLCEGYGLKYWNIDESTYAVGNIYISTEFNVETEKWGRVLLNGKVLGYCVDNRLKEMGLP